MADHRTVVTELVTGLGTLGFDDLDAALAARPAEMASLSPEQWDLLDDLHRGGGYRQEFVAAWQNGRGFLDAADGLRGRRPLIIEWRGGQRQPGDEPVPADLRIDHVYLVSCKYLSQIVTNSSPATVFDRLLAGGHGTRSADWFAEVAPTAYEDLYQATLTWLTTRPTAAEQVGRPDPTTCFDPARRAGPGRHADPTGATEPGGHADSTDPARRAGPGEFTDRAGRIELGGQARPQSPATGSLADVGVDPTVWEGASQGPAQGPAEGGTQVAAAEADGAARLGWPKSVLPESGGATPRVSVEPAEALVPGGRANVGPAGAGSGAAEDGWPGSVLELTPVDRAALQGRLGKGRWAAELRPAALAFSCAVAEASAERWRKALADADPERVLWRLLRIGAAPYFVLGASAEGSLRLRIGTAWDWRQHFRIDDFAVTAAQREQPVVQWAVTVSNRRSRQTSVVEGHVEIRWAHGKFAQRPEAKVYLDTPHHKIPGYWPLT